MVSHSVELTKWSEYGDQAAIAGRSGVSCQGGDSPLGGTQGWELSPCGRFFHRIREIGQFRELSMH